MRECVSKREKERESEKESVCERVCVRDLGRGEEARLLRHGCSECTSPITTLITSPITSGRHVLKTISTSAGRVRSVPGGAARVRGTLRVAPVDAEPHDLDVVQLRRRLLEVLEHGGSQGVAQLCLGRARLLCRQLHAHLRWQDRASVGWIGRQFGG